MGDHSFPYISEINLQWHVPLKSFLCLHDSTLLSLFTDLFPHQQVGATILPPSRPNSQYLYEVYFVTGSRNGSGTTAHVGCEIFGEDDDSGPCFLLDANRPLFRRGDLNVFILSVPRSFGVIRGIKIWHDNSGYSPSWFLCRTMLRDCQTDEKWIFLAGKKAKFLIFVSFKHPFYATKYVRVVFGLSILPKLVMIFTCLL